MGHRWLLVLAWGLFVVVVSGLHHPRQGRGEAKREVSISIVTRERTCVDHASLHKPGLNVSFAIVWDFEPHESVPGHPHPSLRVQGQTVAAELLALAMRAGHISDSDVAAALDVSKSVARRLRVAERCFAVGDLIVLQRRLPDLATLVLGAFERTETP